MLRNFEHLIRLTRVASMPKLSNFVRSSKFETRKPSEQNAVDIFWGKWATDLAKLGVQSGGSVDHLFGDQRPSIAAQHLGMQNRFDGFRILELGPLEGAHTYQLVKLGATEIVAIESNKEAFLKCLIIKELIHFERARFLLGDFVSYLESNTNIFDLVFCCGVLYHSEDPIHLIHLISTATKRCFVWTHYYHREHCSARKKRAVSVHGFPATYFVSKYEGRQGGRFWGGPRPTAVWLEKETILEAFRFFGFSKITVVNEDESNPHGPAITFVAET